jgi:hypothetical protein
MKNTGRPLCTPSALLPCLCDGHGDVLSGVKRLWVRVSRGWGFMIGPACALLLQQWYMCVIMTNYGSRYVVQTFLLATLARGDDE